MIVRDYFWVNCWPEAWTEKQTFQKHFSKDFTQKQPPEVFYKRSWSKNFCNIHRKTPALEFLNKVADLKACNFLKKRLQHSLSLWNIAEYSRIPILKNINKRLLLLTKLWLIGYCYFQNQLFGVVQSWLTGFQFQLQSLKLVQSCSVKKVLLRVFTKIYMKTPGVELQVYQKKIPSQMYSCEFCKIFKNTFFEDHLWMAVSVFCCCLFLNFRGTVSQRMLLEFRE